MQFKVDENLPADVASALVAAGHDAVSIYDQKMTGSTDANISAICKQEHRILVTLDLDFADIRTFPPADHPGLIVMRLRNQDKPQVLKIFGRLLPLLETQPIEGKLWIVDEAEVRVR